MIGFDFEYYKPQSIEEAVAKFIELNSAGKKVLYYGGGTEIISFGRRNTVYADAVIDIKGIPECNILGIRGEELVAGAAASLTNLAESDIFQLMSETSRFAADHTIRNKITLGGNICGLIAFREAVLAFLASDSTAVIAGNQGLKFLPLNEVFNKRLKLGEGEFLVQMRVPRKNINLPYAAIKKTKISRVGYPVVSTGALKKDGQIRVALSGVLSYPFRSPEVERALNDKSNSPEVRAENAIKSFPDKIISDVTASADYREFVTKNTLVEVINILEGK